MARLWQCGFEQNTFSADVEITAMVGTLTMSTTTVRSGSYAARVSSLTSGVARSVSYKFASANGNGPYFFRACFRFATFPSAANRIILLQNSAGTTRAWIDIDSGGVLRLFDGAGQITGTVTLSSNTWYVIEMWYDASGAGSTDTLKACVDGIEFAASTTRNHGSGINTFIVGGNLGTEANTTGDWFIDDLAVNDSTGASQTSYPGMGKIIHLKPSAAGDANTFGTQVGGTAGAANNFTRVNEVTPDDATSYNGSSATGQEDLFNVDDSGLSASDTINLVAVGVRMAASGVDPSITLKLEILKTSGGTKAQSSSFFVSSATWHSNTLPADGPGNYKLVRYTDPDGAAWTNSTLDSMQIGYLFGTANVQSIRVSNLWASVEYIPGAAPSGTETGYIGGGFF